MGIFDFFRRSAPPPPPTKGSAKGSKSAKAATAAGKKGSASKGDAPAKVVDKKVVGHAKLVADKRAQAYDRYDAIRALCELKSPDAAEALLKRFTFSIDPSISDAEEKELAFQGIVDAGRMAKVSKTGKELKDPATREALLKEARIRRKKVIRAVTAFCDRAEQLTWPLKILRELLKDDEYAAALCGLLAEHDTEYSRDVQPKTQIIIALEDVVDEAVRVEVERFLEDVNETVRFHAAETTFAQKSEESVPALVKTLASEESVRIKNKIADGMLKAGWVVPEALRDTANQHLRETDGYSVSADGKMVKRVKPPSFFD